MKLRKNKKEWDADTPITPAGVNTKCTSYRYSSIWLCIWATIAADSSRNIHSHTKCRPFHKSKQYISCTEKPKNTINNSNECFLPS